MPLYEYECRACGVRFERRQRMTDEPVQSCPECGGEVHRLIHPVGIVFKGKGFYVTDNRAKSSTAVPRSTKKESSADGDSKSADKDDAKGETTSE